MTDELREKLADLCHHQWAGWMRYLFSKSRLRGDGSCVISPELNARWLRQMNTPYAELPKAEQDSDRKEADRFLEAIR